MDIKELLQVLINHDLRLPVWVMVEDERGLNIADDLREIYVAEQQIDGQWRKVLIIENGHMDTSRGEINWRQSPAEAHP